MENKAFYYSHRFGKKYHLGRSMIEMLGVLAIIGVLSIGGLYAYRQAMERYRLNELIDFISKVHLASHELCLNSDKCLLALDENNYFSDTNRRLCKSELLPVEACYYSVGAFTTYKSDTLRFAWRISWDYSEFISFEVFGIPETMCRSIVNVPLDHLKYIRINPPQPYFEKQSDGSFKRLSDNAIVNSLTVSDLCVEKNNEIEFKWN